MKTQHSKQSRSLRPRPIVGVGGALYLYGISSKGQGVPPRIAATSVDGVSPVESLTVEQFVCWFSRVDRAEYGEELNRNMEQLEWLATASVRHQAVVDELVSKLEIVPARFGTVFLNQASLKRHLADRKSSLASAFRRISGSVEWGIKVFQAAEQPSSVPLAAASGREYLLRKAESARPKDPGSDPGLVVFCRDLEQVSQEMAPGGKASSGQPGLLWHRSVLVKKTAEMKLMTLLKKHSQKLAGKYRIECSGPWPAYSFVDDDGR